MPSLVFNPFYERLGTKIGLGGVGKVIISAGLGLLFYLPYFCFVGEAAFRDWSWVLALLISCAVMFLYIATSIMFSLFPAWDEHIEGRNSQLYLDPLTRCLSDRNFILGALFFGLANLGMGFLFGIPTTGLAAFWLGLGYFMAGFACGLPAIGIFGVVATFHSFTKTNDLKLDYTDPDRCGGLSFLGNALVAYGIMTLVEGLLIAAYILMVDWPRADNAWVQLAMWLWIIYPFLLSLLVLIVPASQINRMLHRYRLDQGHALSNKCRVLRTKMEEKEITGEKTELIRNEYEYLCNRREEVHSMRTWPYSVGATTSFAGAFISNIVIAAELVRSFM